MLTLSWREMGGILGLCSLRSLSCCTSVCCRLGGVFQIIRNDGRDVLVNGLGVVAMDLEESVSKSLEADSCRAARAVLHKVLVTA